MRRVLALALLVGVGLLLRSDGAPGAAAGEPTGLLTLADHRTPEVRWSIEAHPLARDAGRFAVRVPGRGVYLSVGAAELTVRSPQHTGVLYSGDAELIPDDPAAPISRVAVTLQGHVDPTKRAGEVKLEVGAELTHIVTPAGRPAVPRTLLADLARALAANDWRTVYGLSNSDIRDSYTAEAFVARADAQRSSVGAIASARLASAGPVETNSAGLTYSIATYELRYSPPGPPGPILYDVYWVLEGPGWTVWFSARR